MPHLPGFMGWMTDTYRELEAPVSLRKTLQQAAELEPTVLQQAGCGGQIPGRLRVEVASSWVELQQEGAG